MKQTLDSLQQLKQKNQPIVVLTAYDASFAKLLSEQGVEAILVGDSLGMVIQGHDSTVPVSMDQMVYHTQCVAKGNRGSLIIADMPYMSYADTDTSLKNATRLMQAGANMIKIEGGSWLVPSIKALTEKGIPVCAHLGLTPQSVDALSGFKVQGREQQAADRLVEDALAVEAAGSRLIVLECIPQDLAQKITKQLKIPTIGIGAGNQTDGQVLVLHDLLGLDQDFRPKFVRDFFDDNAVHSISDAIKAYIATVKDRSFPNQNQSFN
ncbi:MAG: 3-methyl-2-oxobutanoate hydroxymethyltransferase [Enterobacterales bacterium]|nr:3-methyl-2-oxobutanoate hydroxymethyltransferase [Enterobacterales bacterium]